MRCVELLQEERCRQRLHEHCLELACVSRIEERANSAIDLAKLTANRQIRSQFVEHPDDCTGVPEQMTRRLSKRAFRVTARQANRPKE